MTITAVPAGPRRFGAAWWITRAPFWAVLVTVALMVAGIVPVMIGRRIVAVLIVPNILVGGLQLAGLVSTDFTGHRPKPLAFIIEVVVDVILFAAAFIDERLYLLLPLLIVVTVAPIAPQLLRRLNATVIGIMANIHGETPEDVTRWLSGAAQPPDDQGPTTG
jgi:hypothetical protein